MAKGFPARTVAFIKANKDEKSDSCLIWPFSKDEDGYGIYVVLVNGHRSRRRAHRLMCQLAHGSAPESRRQVAHSCGNPSCVNPVHLRWASQVENDLDKARHGRKTWGEAHHLAKFTEAQVLAIYQDDRPVPDIARAYRVYRSTIRRIKVGKSWASVTGHHCPIGTLNHALQMQG